MSTLIKTAVLVILLRCILNEALVFLIPFESTKHVWVKDYLGSGRQLSFETGILSDMMLFKWEQIIYSSLDNRGRLEKSVVSILNRSAISVTKVRLHLLLLLDIGLRGAQPVFNLCSQAHLPIFLWHRRFPRITSYPVLLFPEIFFLRVSSNALICTLLAVLGMIVFAIDIQGFVEIAGLGMNVGFLLFLSPLDQLVQMADRPQGVLLDHL